MKIIDKNKKYEGKFLRMMEYKFLTEKGKEGIWEVVERKIYKRIVVIFASTKEKEVILERIYRAPVESNIIELPAGLTDKKGETEETAARRELLEETGFLAEKLIPFYTWPVEPGAFSEKGVLFFAPNVIKREDKRKTEDVEKIEVLRVPLNNLTEFLTNTEETVDIKIFGAFCVAREKGLI